MLCDQISYLRPALVVRPSPSNPGQQLVSASLRAAARPRPGVLACIGKYAQDAAHPGPCERGPTALLLASTPGLPRDHYCTEQHLGRTNRTHRTKGGVENSIMRIVICMRCGYHCHPLLAFEHAGGALYSNQGAMHGERGFRNLPCSTIDICSEVLRSHPIHMEIAMCQCTSDWPLILSAQVSALSRGGVDRGSTMTL